MFYQTQKKIPFEFVLEKLEPISPFVRPMFGCFAIYREDQILFVLRERNSKKNDNGLWIATSPEHHESLKRDLPPLKSISIFGKNSAWRNLPSASAYFEEFAEKACELALHHDPRIGKVPKQRKRKKR